MKKKLIEVRTGKEFNLTTWDDTERTTIDGLIKFLQEQKKEGHTHICANGSGDEINLDWCDITTVKMREETDEEFNTRREKALNEQKKLKKEEIQREINTLVGLAEKHGFSLSDNNAKKH